MSSSTKLHRNHAAVWNEGMVCLSPSLGLQTWNPREGERALSRGSLEMCFCFCIADIVISVGAWARDGSLEKVRSEHGKSRNVLKRVDFDLRVQRWCFVAFFAGSALALWGMGASLWKDIPIPIALIKALVKRMMLYYAGVQKRTNVCSSFSLYIACLYSRLVHKILVHVYILSLFIFV